MEIAAVVLMLVDVNDKAVGILGSLGVQAVWTKTLDVHWIHLDGLARERRFIDGDL